jgi:transposase
MKYFGYFLLAVLFFLSAQATHAQESERRTPLLIVEPLDVHPVGTPVMINALMQNEEGRAIPNMPLILSLDGERMRRTRTDDAGQADLRISQDLSVGTHHLRLEFIGTRAYYPVTIDLTLTIRPLDLTIQTIPPLPNVQFSLNGATISTDENGTALAQLQESGTYNLEALPLPDDVVDNRTRANFRRWGDSIFERNRTIDVRSDTYLEAGYIVSHRVGQTFIDLEGKPVDQSRIDTITLKSSTGDLYTFEDGQLRWLQATRINRNRENLEVTPIMYSVETVNIDGSNVVNRYQQQFFVEPESVWEIEVLLYYAEIRTFDALLGFPVGDGIILEYPNGEIKQFANGPDKAVFIGPMARGTYRVKPTGVEGMAPFTPIALSRSQTAELKVLTVFDMALSAALGVGGAVGILLYGRPQLIRRPLMLLSPILRPRLARVEEPLAVAPVIYLEANTEHSEISQPLQKKKQSIRVRSLSNEETQGLQQLRRGAEQSLIDRRCAMILLSDEGLSPSKIGRQVQYSTQTVRRYIKRYNSEGIRGLFNRPHRGRQPGMTPAYLSQLQQAVERRPEELGLLYSEWTVENLAIYLAGQTGILLDEHQIEDYLNANGGHKAHNRPSAEPGTDDNQEHSYEDKDSEFDRILA